MKGWSPPRWCRRLQPFSSLSAARLAEPRSTSPGPAFIAAASAGGDCRHTAPSPSAPQGYSWVLALFPAGAWGSTLTRSQWDARNAWVSPCRGVRGMGKGLLGLPEKGELKG